MTSFLCDLSPSPFTPWLWKHSTQLEELPLTWGPCQFGEAQDWKEQWGQAHQEAAPPGVLLGLQPPG